MSTWNLLCISKSKGLTKSKEMSIRITDPARHTGTALPFAKLKRAVLTTEEHLQADICYGEVSLLELLPPLISAQWGQNAGESQQLAANPHVVSFRSHSSACCPHKAEERAASSVRAVEKVGGQRLESGVQHNVTWIQRSFMWFAWQRLGSCAHIHTFPS